MRFNETEVSYLASKFPSTHFDKEGVLFMREKQEGFFRRNEILVERWCRLRGNLLFIFKSRDQWSEPVGLIVLEDCQVDAIDFSSTTENSFTYGLIINFNNGSSQQMFTNSDMERNSWLYALQCASYKYLKMHLDFLVQKIECFKIPENILTSYPVIDINESPHCEIMLSCDNLLCDMFGKAPSTQIVVSIKDSSSCIWNPYEATEIVEKSSHPLFLRSIVFRKRPEHSFRPDTEIRFRVLDIREKLTGTSATLCSVSLKFETLSHSSNPLRIELVSRSQRPGKHLGFLTIKINFFDSKTQTSDFYYRTHNLKTSSPEKCDILIHRRSTSLPHLSNIKNEWPTQQSFNFLHAHPIVKTYQLISSLGGEFQVHEIMAESKLCFYFPPQLLSLWISEEKECVHEIAGLGELQGPWNGCQMLWLENHLQTINSYTSVLENIQSHQGRHFRQCSFVNNVNLEFVPNNLHLQRLLIQNQTLRKSKTVDIFTVGAFSPGYASKTGGLIKMLKDLKSPQANSQAWCEYSDKLQMAEDTLSAVRRLRREVVISMRRLMKFGKDKMTEKCTEIIEEMHRQTKCLCSLLDSSIVEEIHSFLEDNRVSVKPLQKDEFSLSVSEFMKRNKLKIELSSSSSSVSSTTKTKTNETNQENSTLITPNSEFVSKELATPEFGSEFWKNSSGTTSGYESVDRLSDIDEFEESFKCLSDLDKTRHYYTLCSKISPIESPNVSPEKVFKKEESDEGIDWDTTNELEPNELFEKEKDENVRVTNSNTDEEESPKYASSSSRLHYRVGDEPEPLDLTSLNIEASMMCLSAKVQLLSQNSLRNPFSQSENLSFPNSKEFKFSQSQTLESNVDDWTSELRPFLLKLRQGMDSLIKTSRLIVSVYRLKQSKDSVDLSAAIKIRRDVVFSQSLTTLVSALLTYFWSVKHQCRELDLSLGPLVTFESTLTFDSSRGNDDLEAFHDMIVAVEDLRSVEFVLFPVEATRVFKTNDAGKAFKILDEETFPYPRVSGSRCSLKVHLPIPKDIYCSIPLNQSQNPSFFITPLFFNIGLTQNGTEFDPKGCQEKNNLDNYKILCDYVRRIQSTIISHSKKDKDKRCGSHYSLDPQVPDLLAILKNEVIHPKSQNLEVLMLVSEITRRLDGLRVTTCRNGKDDTGMSVTLEQVQILSRDFDLADHEYSRTLDAMRSEGTRIENALKNTGIRLYQFDSRQLLSLPSSYRPPLGSYETL